MTIRDWGTVMATLAGVLVIWLFVMVYAAYFWGEAEKWWRQHRS